MRSYADLGAAVEDALRLSEGMTYKYAVAGFPRGGGKAVISVPPDIDTDTRGALLRRYGRLLTQLNGQFYAGPDVGTTPADMDTIAETGAGFVFSRSPESGGAGSSGPLTALGVFSGMETACRHVYGETGVTGRSVLIQGLGSVGSALVRHLLEAGARVSVSDVAEEAVLPFRELPRVTVVPSEDVSHTACDVFSPNALGGVLTREVASRLRCRVVVGGANNQLASEEVGHLLHASGVLYIPDFVVNIGGAMGITGMEAMGWSPAEAADRVRAIVQESVRRTLALVSHEGLLPMPAALRVAEERLAAGG